VASLNFQVGEAKTVYAELAEERTLIVNGILAAQAGFKLGDEVSVSTPEGQQTYRIVAVASDYLNAKIVTAYTSHDNLKADFRKTEDIFIQLNLAPDADRETVEAKLKTIVADYPQFKLVSGQAYYAENKQVFDAVFVVWYIMLAVMTLPSLLALLNTLAIGVLERTREIGMLRAIGATQKQVRRMVLTEALLLAAIGTAFGLLAGLYLGYVMVLGMSTGGYPIEYSFPLSGLLVAVAVGLIFGVLAALVPARQAARMEIVRALQYE
jgi:putative ABC transport system permease protein